MRDDIASEIDLRQTDSCGFLRAPLGCWAAARSGLVWCASPTLLGATLWGTPSPEDLAELVSLLRAIEPLCESTVGPRVTLVFDTSGLERLSEDGLRALVGWLHEERDWLRRRVRLQVSVLGDGVEAMAIAGLLPFVGDTHPFRTARSLDAGLAIAGDAGDAAALSTALAARAAATRGTPRLVAALRGILRQRPGDLHLALAARRLAVSTRTLQRELERAGTSFRDEQREACFAAAVELLTTTDLKVAAVAGRIGISEQKLTLLMREHARTTPAAFRLHRRAAATWSPATSAPLAQAA